MKKIFSLLLAIILMATSFHTFVLASDIILGDANGDAELSAIDARMILQHVAEIEVIDNPTYLDMNEDGEISAIDARIVLQVVAELIETPTHTHTYSDATCTLPATCSCGATNGDALGHDYIDATCINPKTCSRCNETEGNTIPHDFVEISSTDGSNVGSVITYSCSMCKETKTEEIQPLTLNVYRSSEVSINGWLSQVSYTANATGGCGKYEYKFEVYLTENSTSPALTEDFSEHNVFGWTSRFYCNDNMLIITVRDEAGNEATKKIIVE